MNIKSSAIMTALIAIGNGWASAQMPCDTIAHLIGTLSIVNEIQSHPSEQIAPASIDALESRLARLSLDTFHSHELSGIGTANGAITYYVEDLNYAVTAYHSGAYASARSILIDTASPAVRDNIVRLQETYQCTRDIIAQNGGSAETGIASGSTSLQSGPDIRRTMRWEFVIALLGMVALGTRWCLRRRKRTIAQRAERQLCHRPVMIRTGRRDVEMIIVDIAYQGMKLKHPGLIKKNQQLAFQIEDEWVKGKVRWHNGAYAGVKFQRALTVSQYQLLSAEGGAADNDDTPPQTTAVA